MLALGLVSACADIPALEAFPPAASSTAPELVPLDRLLAEADSPSDRRADGACGARGAAAGTGGLMRGPVLDPETRARLATAIEAGRA
ncbi:MAG: hypothetical protein HC844_10105 [Tabrizicola sp.]|nr:hypothetical protein [Tabrizicola sp.]